MISFTDILLPQLKEEGKLKLIFMNFYSSFRSAQYYVTRFKVIQSFTIYLV